MSDPRARIEAFRAMHESGCFVSPNPWDVGSARMLEQLGFRALASTSAGLAFSRGLPDTVTAIPCDVTLAHLRDLADATSLPLSADFQAGYASDPEGVAANVKRCLATGVAGLSIEDATGERASPLYERGAAIERVRAARSTIDAAGSGAVLTARCEAFLVGEPEPFRVVCDRLVAYADAGADCLFAPGVRDARRIAELVRAVAPKPLNVIVASPLPDLSVARLAELGVRRVSVGSALARVAWAAFERAARQLHDEGTFDALADAMPFATLNRTFERS
jgi:2-methylisocitrate lyase-like PEP mutase family enzyme